MILSPSDFTPPEIAHLMTAGQQLVLGTGWGLFAIFNSGFRRAMLWWTAHGLLHAASLVAYVLALHAGDNLPLRIAGNLLLLLSLMALHRGLSQFLGSRPRHWLHALMLLAAGVAAVIGLNPQAAAVRLLLFTALITLMIWVIAVDVMRGGRSRFGARPALLLALPALGVGLMFGARLGGMLVMARGDLDRLASHYTIDFTSGALLMMIALALHLMLVAVVVSRLVTDLRQLSQQDALTGVLNRRAFEEALAGEILRSGRLGQPFSLLLLDVDHFKNINDSRGHAAGDEVLRRLALLLKRQMRSVDRVARIGGEEFAMLLPGAGQAEAGRVAERIRQRLSSMEFDLGRSVTASLGVAQWRPGLDDAASLMARADAALYRAKADGRDTVALSEHPSAQSPQTAF